MAEVTGVSRSTVDQVRKEKETVLFLSPKKTVEHGPNTSIDGFDQAAITEFYTKDRRHSLYAFKVFKYWCLYIKNKQYMMRKIKMIKNRVLHGI